MHRRSRCRCRIHAPRRYYLLYRNLQLRFVVSPIHAITCNGPAPPRHLLCYAADCCMSPPLHSYSLSPYSTSTDSFCCCRILGALTPTLFAVLQLQFIVSRLSNPRHTMAAPRPNISTSENMMLIVVCRRLFIFYRLSPSSPSSDNTEHRSPAAPRTVVSPIQFHAP